jgi:hypothetical protein
VVRARSPRPRMTDGRRRVIRRRGERRPATAGSRAEGGGGLNSRCHGCRLCQACHGLWRREPPPYRGGMRGRARIRVLVSIAGLALGVGTGVALPRVAHELPGPLAVAARWAERLWTQFLPPRMSLRERLAASSATWRPVAPPPAHHDHYCEECDRHWVHEGHMCATPWASPCARECHPGAGTVRRRLGRWFIVVRRDRAELCQQLGESFGGDPRITVILDRRQSERRGTRGPLLLVAAERRRWKDRRTPPTDEDGPMWASLGFQPHRDRSLGPR